MKCCRKQSFQASAVHQVFYDNLMRGSEHRYLRISMVPTATTIWLRRLHNFIIIVIYTWHMTGHFIIYCATLLSDKQWRYSKMSATGSHSSSAAKRVSSNPSWTRRPQSANMTLNGLDALITPGLSALSSSWHPGLQSSRATDAQVCAIWYASSLMNDKIMFNASLDCSL